MSEHYWVEQIWESSMHYDKFDLDPSIADQHEKRSFYWTATITARPVSTRRWLLESPRLKPHLNPVRVLSA